MSQTGRPRILHLTTTGAVAGAEKLLIDLAETHDTSIWDITYCTLFERGEMHERIEAAGSQCLALNMRRESDAVAAALRLRNLISERKIELVHSHLFHAMVLAYAASKVLPGSRPILANTRHYTDEMHRYHSRSKAQLDGAITRRQDLVFAISQSAFDVLARLDHVDERKITINRPGVLVDKLNSKVDPDAATELRNQLGADGLLIGVVARLVEKKGHRFLLEIAQRLVDVSPGLKIVIVGDGPERSALEQIVNDLRLKQIVTFLGYRSDIPTIVSAVDLIVQPSLEEGLPVSLVEAMALGKPVVSTKISGIPELVADGETGLLCESGDCNALYDAVARLLTDAILREKMSAAARTRVELEFSMSRHACVYETGWSRLLADRAVRR